MRHDHKNQENIRIYLAELDDDDDWLLMALIICITFKEDPPDPLMGD